MPSSFHLRSSRRLPVVEALLGLCVLLTTPAPAAPGAGASMPPAQCSLTASTTTIVGTGALSLFAECKGGGAVSQWNWRGGFASDANGSTVSGNPTQTTTYSIHPGNSAGYTSTVSLTVTVIAAPSSPATSASCESRGGQTECASWPATAAEHIALAVEFYNATSDHYLVTAAAREIEALDAGTYRGWLRTGLAFKVLKAGGGAGVAQVCRYDANPLARLDSHFYSASSAECDAVGALWPGEWLLDSADGFHVYVPDVRSGACPAETTPVYRSWNQRTDSNHRYTIDPAVHAQMLAHGAVAEGYGDPPVAMCVPR